MSVSKPPNSNSLFPISSSKPRNSGSRKVSKGRALDLFSGTGSVGTRLRDLGYEVTSIDIDPRTKPTICQDILEWDFTQYLPGTFKIVAASVPCTEYSIAKTTASREYYKADKLVLKVLDAVKFLKPKFWWVENARHGF